MCESLALRATGASYARAFDFTLRDSRIKGVHTKPGGDNSARGPVNGVHTDYTDNSPGVQSIKHLLYNKMGLGKDVRFSLMKQHFTTPSPRFDVEMMPKLFPNR